MLKRYLRCAVIPFRESRDIPKLVDAFESGQPREAEKVSR